MPLNLYYILKMVEEEITAMKKRQQFVIGTYQQQTREDLFKKFVDAEHSLLEITEEKVKELDIPENSTYFIKGNRKEATLAVRRIKDERSLMIEIDPIIYPTDFNLRFILNEPSVTLHSPSMLKGIVSLNANTTVRATDSIEVISFDDINNYISLWLKPSSEGFKKKLNSLISKIGSEEFLIESMLTFAKDPPDRNLIYLCKDHSLKPEAHAHSQMVDVGSVNNIIMNHLRLG
jgi:hypothetical protein